MQFKSWIFIEEQVKDLVFTLVLHADSDRNIRIALGIQISWKDSGVATFVSGRCVVHGGIALRLARDKCKIRWVNCYFNSACGIHAFLIFILHAEFLPFSF